MNRPLAARLVLGAFVVLAVFFAFQRDRMPEVWKPLLLYVALAIPGYFVLSKLRPKPRPQP